MGLEHALDGKSVQLGAKDNSAANRRLLIILAVLIVSAAVITALVLDGGASTKVVKTAQQAADAGASEAVRFLDTTGQKDEAELMMAINESVESHGIPDSDGKSGNLRNDNVAAYYTNENGVRISGCSEVGLCGTVPEHAQFIKVVVVNDYDPLIAGILGFDSLGIAAEAISSISSASS